MGGAFEQSEYYVRLYAESPPMAYLLIFTVFKYVFIYTVQSFLIWIRSVNM